MSITPPAMCDLADLGARALELLKSPAPPQGLMEALEPTGGKWTSAIRDDPWSPVADAAWEWFRQTMDIETLLKGEPETKSATGEHGDEKAGSAEGDMCLAHLRPEPCPVCAAYVAAGL